MKVLEGRKPGRANQWHARIPSTTRTQRCCCFCRWCSMKLFFIQTGLERLTSLS